MKRLLCTAAALIAGTASFFAVEWGGKIANDTSFMGKADDLKLKQSDTVGLWMNIPLNRTNSVYVAAEAYYKFTYDDTETADEEFENVINCNLLKLSAGWMAGNGNMISLSAGRFPVSDFTGIIFNQPADGLNFKVSSQAVDFSIFAGYTGLLNAKEVTILTPADTEYEESDDDFYAFAPKYLPFGFSFAFPSVFGNQHISLEGWGFADLNGDDCNRYYGMLGLDGYLLRNLSYNVKTVFGTKNFDSLMNFSSLSFDLNPAGNFGIKLYGTYASGKQGSLSAFSGFTSMTAVSTRFADLEYSSMVTGGLQLSNVFAGVLYASLGGAVLFECPDSSVEYFGMQLSADVLWNIFYDVQLGLSASQFIGDDSDNSKTTLSVKAVIAF